jgi:hypothetical protein
VTADLTDEVSRRPEEERIPSARRLLAERRPLLGERPLRVLRLGRRVTVLHEAQVHRDHLVALLADPVQGLGVVMSIRSGHSFRERGVRPGWVGTPSDSTGRALDDMRQIARGEGMPGRLLASNSHHEHDQQSMYERIMTGEGAPGGIEPATIGLEG